MEWMSKTDQSIQVYVSPETKKMIKAISTRTGMTQTAIFTRLLIWFELQDDVLQQAVLGQLPPSIRPDVARIVLERMAAEKKVKAS